VNGQPVDVPLLPATYASLRRRWRSGDRVLLVLPTPVRFLEAHPRALEDAGRVAVTRGPLLYCLESEDHPGVPLQDVEVDPSRPVDAAWEPDLLGGVVVLRGTAGVRPLADGWRDRLYLPVEAAPGPGQARPLPLTAVPYLAWGNRRPGAMRVWLRRG
jgi:DUF1680 family protein